MIRINKYLSEAGFCSRRQADKLLEQGKVTVNGQVLVPGSKIDDNDEVYVNGKKVIYENDNVILAFNKPKGIICTTTDRYGDNNIISCVGYEKRIYPIGRLDKDSEGLILLTDNGEVMNNMLNAALYHEKEYLVKVDRFLTAQFIEGLTAGVYLKDLDKKTMPCNVTPVYKNGDEKTKEFRIVLTQGLNRQIRRMCEAFGYHVRKLKRIRIMNIKLGNTETGKYRIITGEEKKELFKQLKIKM